MKKKRFCDQEQPAFCNVFGVVMGKKKPAKKQPMQPVEVRVVVGQPQPPLARRMIPPMGAQVPQAVPMRLAQRPQSLDLPPMQPMYAPSRSSTPGSDPGLMRTASPLGTSMGPPSSMYGYQQNHLPPPPLTVPGGVKVMPDIVSQQMMQRHSMNDTGDKVSQVLNELDETLQKYEHDDYSSGYGSDHWKQSPVSDKSLARPSSLARQPGAEPPPDYDDHAPVSPYENGHARHSSASSNDSTPNSSVRAPYPRVPVSPFDKELKAKLERRSQQVPESSGEYGRGLTPQEPIKKTHFTMANARNVAHRVNEEFANQQRRSDSPRSSAVYPPAPAPQADGRSCWGKNCRDPDHCYCQHRQLPAADIFRPPIRS